MIVLLLWVGHSFLLLLVYVLDRGNWISHQRGWGFSPDILKHRIGFPRVFKVLLHSHLDFMFDFLFLIFFFNWL